MKKILIISLILLMTLTVGIGFAFTYGQHLCPVCDSSGYYTGQTKTEWGHLFYLYKCPSEHYWWERAN